MRGLSDKRLIRSRFGAAFVNPWRESREFPLDLWCMVREGNYPSFRCRKQAMNSRTVFAVVTVVLFGLGLRLLFGSTSALTSDIAAFYSADSVSMALLTTGPVVVLGVCAAAAGFVLRRARVTHVLVGCLILIAVGTAVRAVPSWPVLVAGTLVAAAGIAVANVLGPVLVRVIVQEWSPQGRPENPAVSARRLGLLTGVLTAVISASAGVASGVSVPLAEALDGGWRWVLGLWAVPEIGRAHV